MIFTFFTALQGWHWSQARCWIAQQPWGTDTVAFQVVQPRGKSWMWLYVTKPGQVGQPGILHQDSICKSFISSSCSACLAWWEKKKKKERKEYCEGLRLKVYGIYRSHCWALDASYALGPEGRATMFWQVKGLAPTLEIYPYLGTNFPKYPEKRQRLLVILCQQQATNSENP